LTEDPGAETDGTCAARGKAAASNHAAARTTLSTLRFQVTKPSSRFHA
jgi:hypothetical protein